MSLRWYPWHIEDYAHDTRHLTLAEHGAYRLLIDAYMDEGGPLPDNDRALARIIGVGVDEWLRVAANVRAFFRPQNGALTHKRCEQELRAQELRSQKQSEKAKKAAFTRYSKPKRLAAPSMLQACLDHATLNKETITTTEQGAEKGPSKNGFGVTPELTQTLKARGWA